MKSMVDSKSHLAEELRRFRYRRYDFMVRFGGSSLPADWAPNLVRGAFGATLRRITCFCPNREGEVPEHREGCVYAEMFESPVALIPGAAGRVQTCAPHPFAMHFPPIRGDGSGRVEVVLFGHALRYFPYVLMTFVAGSSTSTVWL